MNERILCVCVCVKLTSCLCVNLAPAMRYWSPAKEGKKKRERESEGLGEYADYLNDEKRKEIRGQSTVNWRPQGGQKSGEFMSRASPHRA